MLSFLILGDWGREGTPGQRAVSQGMAQMARRLRCRFVISTGDNFYEEGVASADDPLWQRSFESVYNADTLQVPWYAVLGNHDYRGNVEAQIAHSRHSPRWNLPARYYTVTHQVDPASRVQFFFLDTTPFLRRYHPGGPEHIEGVAEQNVQEQLEWLRRSLSGSTASWKIVVGHHPIYSGSPIHGGAVELQEALLPELRAHGVQLYLCGHEHDLQHICADGMHHIVSGAGSDCRSTGEHPSTRYCSSRLGFAACVLTAERMHLWFCDAAGSVLYHDSATRSGARLMYREAV